MSLHTIVGAGPVGSATARLLADSGEQVRLLTRSGRGPHHDEIHRIAADASDSAALARHAEGAVALYCCAGPAYHRWSTDWPPLGTALIRAAESSGAALVTTGNLYAYGQVDAPMTEQLPLRPNSVKGQVRATLWAEALAAHEAGRIRTAEVRGSDYLGAGAVSPFTAMVLPKVLAGQRGSVPADLDTPHSWTYVGDVARTLVAVAAAKKAWGRAWHVPTAPPLSVRELATRATELAGAPPGPSGHDARFRTPPRRTVQSSRTGDARGPISVAPTFCARLVCRHRRLRDRTDPDRRGTSGDRRECARTSRDLTRRGILQVHLRERVTPKPVVAR